MPIDAVLAAPREPIEDLIRPSLADLTEDLRANIGGRLTIRDQIRLRASAKLDSGRSDPAQAFYSLEALAAHDAFAAKALRRGGPWIHFARGVRRDADIVRDDAERASPGRRWLLRSLDRFDVPGARDLTSAGHCYDFGALRYVADPPTLRDAVEALPDRLDTTRFRDGVDAADDRTSAVHRYDLGALRRDADSLEMRTFSGAWQKARSFSGMLQGARSFVDALPDGSDVTRLGIDGKPSDQSPRSCALVSLARSAATAEERATLRKDPAADDHVLSELCFIALATEDFREAEAIYADPRIQDLTLSRFCERDVDNIPPDPEDRRLLREHPVAGRLTLSLLGLIARDPDERRAMRDHPAANDDTLPALAFHASDPDERRALREHPAAGGLTLSCLYANANDEDEARTLDEMGRAWNERRARSLPDE